jgi:hypothetical protein
LIETANKATAKAAARHPDLDLPPTMAELRRNGPLPSSRIGVG